MYELNEADDTCDLYFESLLGLAESELNGKLAFQIQTDLAAIATEFRVKVSTTKKDYKMAIAKVKAEQSTHSREKQSPTAITYSPEIIERSTRIWSCPAKFAVWHKDFNDTGYKADEIKTKVAFLAWGFRFINLRAWGNAHNWICGTQTGISGPSGTGKSAFVKNLVNFIDCSLAKQQKRVEEISDCSEQYLAFAGGDDGKSLTDKVIYWDELNSRGSMDYGKKVQIMSQTTTKGYYTHRSSAESSNGTRQPVEYKLIGTLHHIFTTTEPPSGFEQQFRNRTIWLRIDKSEAERWSVFGNKFKATKTISVDYAQKQNLYASWNHIEDLAGFKRLDPEDSTAFADVEMPFLSQVINEERDRKTLKDDDVRRIDILMVLIATHAIIHQQQRETVQKKDGQSVLIADVEDYNAVVSVFNECVIGENTAITKAEQIALEQLLPSFKEKAHLTIQECMIHLSKSKRTIWSYVKSWHELGIISKQRVSAEILILIGPALLKEAGTNSDVDAQIEAARRIFGMVKGFRAVPLPVQEEVTCQCSFHSAQCS
jgi:hypothetical protein